MSVLESTVNRREAVHQQNRADMLAAIAALSIVCLTDHIIGHYIAGKIYFTGSQVRYNGGIVSVFF